MAERPVALPPEKGSAIMADEFAHHLAKFAKALVHRSAQRVKFLIDTAESSILDHRFWRTFRDVCYSSASGGKADISQRWRTIVDFMSTRPSVMGPVMSSLPE